MRSVIPVSKGRKAFGAVTKWNGRAFTQPLVVHFVCHESDKEIAAPLINLLYASFSRNVRFPYSSRLNIPMFVWKGNAFSVGIPEGRLGEKTVVFAFTSGKSCLDTKWAKALNRFNKPGKKIFVVPIALNAGGVAIPFRVGFNNVIAYYKFTTEKDMRLVLSAAQAICQHCYRPRDAHRQIRPLSVFLSHTKSDKVGFEIVARMRDVISAETTLGRFIDINNIQAGEPFDGRILNSVKDQVFLAIVTDNYSTRRWCQLEAIWAKESGVPMLVMNCVTKGEDRLLPSLSNVPSIRPILNADRNEDVISTAECLRVIQALMLESLRGFYLRDKLGTMKRNRMFECKGKVLIRPPEADVLTCGVSSVLYPDPPILPEEKRFYFGKKIQLHTPIDNGADDSFRGISVGASISDPEDWALASSGVRLESLKRLSQDLAQIMFQRGARVLYGGDLRPREEDSFTAFILDEGKIAKQRLRMKYLPVCDYLAWPIYRKQEDAEIEFQIQYNGVAEWKHVEPPRDLIKVDGFDAGRYLKPDTAEHLYCWARSLTAMREEAVEDSTCRICAGGKLTNYKGMMPGVVEEILIAIESGKPLFLLGGFGGATASVVSSILSGELEESLTLEWQEAHSLGYSDLVDVAERYGHPVDYSRLSILNRCKIKKLAQNAGLHEVDYRRLMESPYEDECVRLIVKGINSLCVKARRRLRRAETPGRKK